VTIFIFLPAFGFLLFVLFCWAAAFMFLRRGKKKAGVAAFLLPLPFILIIALGRSDEALFLRLTLFDLWFGDQN
jgi:hypothetical protein